MQQIFFIKITHQECCILTPKGPRPIFSKNTPNLPFLAQEAQAKFVFILFSIVTIRSCPRLL
jgi:hypothetical protein